jgi:hypothetical protein
VHLTLKKERTGAWSRRGERAGLAKVAGFKGWQRLWLVTSIVYLVLLVAAGFLLMPDRNRIERAMIFAVTEEAKRYDGLAFAGEPPSRVFESARREGFSVWIAQVRKKYKISRSGDAGFEAIDRKYRQELSELATNRLLLGIRLFCAWLLPVALLYLAGLVLDWIGRGKREA